MITVESLDWEMITLFIATWSMILPLYYYIGELKSQLKSCPVCKKAIAERDLKEAEAEGA